MTALDRIFSETPPRGQSHRWIWRALCAVLRHAPDTADGPLLLAVAARFPDGGTQTRQREILDSIPNARRWAREHPLPARPDAQRWRPQPPTATFPPPPPPAPIPKPDPHVTAPRCPVNDLWVLRAEDAHPDAWRTLCNEFTRPSHLPNDRLEACRQVLDSLYQPGDLVCAGEDVRKMQTLTFAEWGDALLDAQHIVPNPMAARTGLTKDGRPSARTLANACTRRRFVTVEFDGPSVTQQASRIAWLQQTAPAKIALVMVMHSGGKSVHALFHVEKCHPRTVRAWFRSAVALGADPAMWTPHQPGRLPCGLRRPSMVTQEVLFFCARTIF